MSTQLSPNHLALPPVELDLNDADLTVGWIAHDTVGFRGFADETEASHGAWVAYRALARRLAREDGTRPVPIDIEPLALTRNGDQEVILAGGRPIATLVRPGAESRSGNNSFGFEIRVPPPADEVRVGAMAYLMYRTLRKSGIRWALRRPSALPPAEARPTPAMPRSAARRRVARVRRPTSRVARVAIAAIAIVIISTLAMIATPMVTMPLVVVFVLGAIAAGLVMLDDRGLLSRAGGTSLARTRGRRSPRRQRTHRRSTAVVESPT